MKADVLKFDEAVTLVGGGALTREMVDEAQSLAPRLIAADGAADRLSDWGLMPDAIIGDMDSISDMARWQDTSTTLLHLPEQETTDFAKCLYATEAPTYVAAGFTGKRLDHTLAVFNAMLQWSQKSVILIGEEEVVALCPPARVLSLTIGAGETVSIYPLRPVQGLAAEGLRWPIDGLAMEPGGQIGTSNQSVEDRIQLSFDGAGALLMIGRKHLRELHRALQA
ncbi:MAG: thiamine diphosphokinase [Pseudomonadota bacterium]